MKDVAIKKICFEMEKEGYEFNDKTLLDVFARDGSWQTAYISSLVKQTTAWEINKDFKEKLIKNLPKNSKIKIGNSHHLIEKEEEKFDIIVFDNPMACFGNNNEYSEHFDIIEKFRLVSNNKVLLIFNVKTKPFNYNEKYNWQTRRNMFYKTSDASNISIKKMTEFYDNFFTQKNHKILKRIIKKRPQENDLYQFCYYLENINENSKRNKNTRY